MDSKTLDKLIRLRKRINRLEAGFPTGISVEAWDKGDARVSDGSWRVMHNGADIKLLRDGYGYGDSEALPEGVRAELHGNKRYVLFVDGTGKEVNYLLGDGLSIRRVGDTRYKALDPIQDYIIDECPVALKAEEALADKMRDYIRAMWHMVELPSGFYPDSSYARINYRDTSTWHNLIVQHKFAYEHPRYGWQLRSQTYIEKQRDIPTHKGVIRKINDFFKYSHLGYSVKKKTPYTPPHTNEFWSQLKRLQEAGLVPE